MYVCIKYVYANFDKRNRYVATIIKCIHCTYLCDTKEQLQPSNCRTRLTRLPSELPDKPSTALFTSCSQRFFSIGELFWAISRHWFSLNMKKPDLPWVNDNENIYIYVYVYIMMIIMIIHEHHCFFYSFFQTQLFSQCFFTVFPYKTDRDRHSQHRPRCEDLSQPGMKLLKEDILQGLTS